MSQRKQRVEQRIKEEISSIIHEQIKDPRIGFVTLTRVELKDDLRYAKVFYSVLGDEKQKTEAKQGLESAHNYIRKLLGDSLDLRNTPDFCFKVDESIEYDIHMAKIFNEIEEERKQREGLADDQETDTGKDQTIE
ncbi:MAG: 30S ribosome-binding factor RbfA [Candidatus Omnitrophica bacterium]|nr:30S ribosome-binding factor RbfA [Candidatus Omnitrophota bacterium]